MRLKNAFYLSLISLFFLSGFTQTADNTRLARKSQEATQAMERGDFATAISLYRELSQELPDVAGLEMNLGLAHYMAGQRAEAIPFLKSAVTKDPDLSNAWLFLASAQLDLGRTAQAEQSFRAYLEANPRELNGRLGLAETLFLQNKLEEAADEYGKIVKQDPKNARAWYGMGRSYEALSAEAFRRLEASDPESGYVYALIAASRVVQQQYSSAFFFYRKALEKLPRLRGIHVAVSRIYRETGHQDWAAAEEAKELELGVPDCAKEPIVCLFLSGKFKEVLLQVRGKETHEAYYWRSQVSNQLAVAAFSKLMSLPPSYEVHALVAQIHRNQGRHWESVKEWRKALELEPENPEARRELAISLYLNRNYDDARPLVNELLKEDPESPRLNFLAGDILLYEQRASECLPFLEKATRNDPSYIAAHSSLGRAYMHLGKAEQAIPHLKAALEADEDGSLHYQLARAYQRIGDREKAAQALKRYQEIKRLLQAEDTKMEEEVKITPP